MASNDKTDEPVFERLAAVVFDIGDTLFPEIELRYQCMEVASRQLGEEGRVHDVERFLRTYREIDSSILGPDVNHLVSDERIVRRVLESCGESVARGLALRYLAIHRSEVWSRLRRVDGLPSLFESLRRRGLKLGVLTDGTTYDQYVILARLGVLPFVDEVVTSEEVGASKPATTMFATILSRLDVAAGRALMVGNNWERDIEGARAAGMLTAYLSQSSTVGEADLFIRNVLDIEHALAKAC